MDKVKLRQSLLQQRQAMSEIQWREKSDRLCSHLLPYLADAQTVLAYFSVRQEPDLSALFLQHSHWGFPRCVERSLVWQCWSPGEPLQTGKYGILTPSLDAPQIAPETVDLILVPAVACDRQGYRLGYGGGYYDRLLSTPQWQNKRTIGIVFEFAYVPELPIESWDCRLHAVCTELGLKLISD
jgi:5-formyltetrahydrofolate cyclo-ligase